MLVVVTSLITWIPGLLLVVVQANQAGVAWLWDNSRIPLGIFVGSWIWILTISLVALALSAWIKLRPGTIFALFGLFFVLGAFGFLVNQMLELRPAWGVLLNLNTTMRALWEWLFLGQGEYGLVFERGRLIRSGVPSWAAPACLLVFSMLSLALLLKKIRACEVVR